MTKVNTTSKQMKIFNYFPVLLMLIFIFATQSYSQNLSPMGGVTVWGDSVAINSNELNAGGKHGILKWNDASGEALDVVVAGEVAAGVFNSTASNIAAGNVLSTGLNQLNETIPVNYYLEQNYPNTFNPSTNINFSIPKAGFVKLTVFDESRREVSKMVNKNLAAGNYSYNFKASGLASGTYIYMLNANDDVEIRKMILVK